MLHTRNWTVTFDQVSKSPSHLAIILDDAHIYTPASNCLRVWILIFGVSVLVNTHSPRPLTDHLYEALSLSLSLSLSLYSLYFISLLSISFFLSLSHSINRLPSFFLYFFLSHTRFLYISLFTLFLTFSLPSISPSLYISISRIYHLCP